MKCHRTLRSDGSPVSVRSESAGQVPPAVNQREYAREEANGRDEQHQNAVPKSLATGCGGRRGALVAHRAALGRRTRCRSGKRGQTGGRSQPALRVPTVDLPHHPSRRAPRVAPRTISPPPETGAAEPKGRSPRASIPKPRPWPSSGRASAATAPRIPAGPRSRRARAGRARP